MSEQSIVVEDVSLSFPKKKSILQIFKSSDSSSFLALNSVSFSVKREKSWALSAAMVVESQRCSE